MHAAGSRQVGQLLRQHGEAETPMSNQSPRVNQGRRLLGPAVLRTCPFASLLSQVRARLGPGGYCRCSRNGGPQTCLPAACGVAQRGAQHGPSSSTQTQDPREGPSLTGRTTRSFLRHGLIRLAREEAERSRRGTSRGAHDASHDDHCHKSIVTTMDGKLQAFDLFVMLHLNLHTATFLDCVDSMKTS